MGYPGYHTTPAMGYTYAAPLYADGHAGSGPWRQHRYALGEAEAEAETEAGAEAEAEGEEGGEGEGRRMKGEG